MLFWDSSHQISWLSGGWELGRQGDLKGCSGGTRTASRVHQTGKEHPLYATEFCERSQLTKGFALDILDQVATINAFFAVIVGSLWFLEMPTVNYKAN